MSSKRYPEEFKIEAVTQVRIVAMPWPTSPVSSASRSTVSTNGSSVAVGATRGMSNALPTASPTYGPDRPSAVATVDNAIPQGSTYRRGNSVQTNGAGSTYRRRLRLHRSVLQPQAFHVGLCACRRTIWRTGSGVSMSRNWQHDAVGLEDENQGRFTV